MYFHKRKRQPGCPKLEGSRLFDQDFSAEFFHLAVDQVRDAMLIMSLDGSLRYANRAAIDLYGFDKSELLKLNIRHLRARTALASYRRKWPKQWR